MKNYYPYRFKTEQEFIESYGEKWGMVIKINGPNWCSDMDYLFGKLFPFTKDKLNFKDSKYPIHDRWQDRDNWLISWKMLTKNIQIPNYKPKKIIRKI
jgi:hypothetical protein